MGRKRSGAKRSRHFAHYRRGWDEPRTRQEVCDVLMGKYFEGQRKSDVQKSILPLFKTIAGVATLRRLPRAGFSPSAEQSVLVCESGSGRFRGVPKEEFSDASGHLWRLCYVVSTCSENVYFRHASAGMSCWWVQKSGKPFSVPLREQLVLSGGNFACVCLYEKQCNTSAQQIRDMFLGSLGGQSRVVCERHSTPLVTTSKYGPAACCIRDGKKTCSNKVWYGCPWPSCSVYVCKRHMQGALDQSSTCDSVSVGFVSGICSTSGGTGETRALSKRQRTSRAVVGVLCAEPDAGEAGDSDSGGDEIGPGTEFAGGGGMGENDTDDISTASAGCELLAVGERFAGNGDTDIGFEDLIDNSEHSGCEGQGENATAVPMANVAREPVHIAGSNFVARVAGHAVLNNCGTLLTRKNVRLDGSRNERSFLQRIVSGHTGVSVPLVYAEGMLFPSLFFAENSYDGALLGAFPTVMISFNRLNLSRFSNAGFAHL